MAEKRAPEYGKLQFVRQMLQDDPKANERSINQAWKEAGYEGSISQSSITQVKAKLGMTRPGLGRAKQRTPEPEATPARGGSRTPAPTKSPADDGKAAATVPAAPLAAAPEVGGRDREIAEFEREFDRVLFHAMALGNLPEVEEAIRKARRLFILSTGGRP